MVGVGVLLGILVWRGVVAVWAGHIEDDLGGFGICFFGDGGEGAEELVGDVGEDGGAAGRDFVLGEEEEQAGEEVVDLGGGGEVVEVGGEGGGDFDGVVLVCRERRVSGAKVGVAVGGVETAAPAVGKTIGAAGGVVDEAGFSGLLGHLVVPLREIGFEKTGGNAEGAENKGIAEKAIRKLMKTLLLKIDDCGGRKENAHVEAQDKETQRARSFAEQEDEGRLSCEGADLAEERESDSDGGLGTSYLPFLCGREVEVRGCELRRVVPSLSEVDGSPILPGQAATNPADSPP